MLSLVLYLTVTLSQNSSLVKSCQICHYPKSNSAYVTETEFKSLYAKIAPKYGHTSRSYDRTLYIAKRESNKGRVKGEVRLDSKAQNSKSSAYGKYGFLNQTWKNVGVKKTDCKSCQMDAFFRYVKRRYGGSLDRAYNHHKTKGWY